jgi:hypothetical protein
VVIYIYMYMEREREREREVWTSNYFQYAEGLNVPLSLD